MVSSSLQLQIQTPPEDMGVTYGKKREHNRPHPFTESRTHVNGTASTHRAPGHWDGEDQEQNQNQGQDRNQEQDRDQNQEQEQKEEQEEKEEEEQEEEQEEQEQRGELQTPPGPDRQEEDSRDLILPQKLLNPVSLSRSHQELHKELRLSYKGAVCAAGRPELRRVLERRNWERGMKQRREAEEEKKNKSPFHQELIKRHQRLETLQRELDQQQGEGQSSPEFLRVRERLRRTRSRTEA